MKKIDDKIQQDDDTCGRNYRGDWILRLEGMLSLIMEDKNLSPEDQYLILKRTQQQINDCRQQLIDECMDAVEEEAL